MYSGKGDFIAIYKRRVWTVDIAYSYIFVAYNGQLLRNAGGSCYVIILIKRFFLKLVIKTLQRLTDNAKEDILHNQRCSCITST